MKTARFAPIERVSSMWRWLATLVAKIVELMDRYDVSGYVGASVYRIDCGILAVPA